MGYHFYTTPPYGHPSLEEGSWGMGCCGGLSLLYLPALRAPLLRGGELGDVAVGYHFYTSPPYGHPSLEEGSWGMLRWVVVATPNSPPSKEGYPVRGGVVCQHKTTCKVTTKKLPPFIFCHKQNSPLFSFVISKNLRSSFFMRCTIKKVFSSLSCK